MNNRVVFFGTPQIAVACLQALVDSKINVVAVVTKPDLPIGRKQEIQESEVKVFAKKHNIRVLQPNQINEIYEELIELKPDLFIVCAYGKIISEKILQIPKFHCVNVHTSLLPRWRGGAPIHYAIWHGDKKTGISLMYMTKELDAGNVIYQEAITIDENETYQSLYSKLSQLAYDTLKKQINNLFQTNIPSQPQDAKLVTIAKNISRDDEKISWNKTNNEIEQQIRAFFDRPIAYTIYQNTNLKIYEGIAVNLNTNSQSGTIVQIDKNGIDVACGNHKILRITKLQLPGKKPIIVKQMVNGNHPFKKDTSFTY